MSTFMVLLKSSTSRTIALATSGFVQSPTAIGHIGDTTTNGNDAFIDAFPGRPSACSGPCSTTLPASVPIEWFSCRNRIIGDFFGPVASSPCGTYTLQNSGYAAPPIV